VSADSESDGLGIEQEDLRGAQRELSDTVAQFEV